MAVWAWRTTPQPSLGGLSPYRVLLGLQPRTPFAFSAAPVGRRSLQVPEFVKEMTEVHESTMRLVKAFRAKNREAQDEAQAKKGQTTTLGV